MQTGIFIRDFFFGVIISSVGIYMGIAHGNLVFVYPGLYVLDSQYQKTGVADRTKYIYRVMSALISSIDVESEADNVT